MKENKTFLEKRKKAAQLCIHLADACVIEISPVTDVLAVKTAKKLTLAVNSKQLRQVLQNRQSLGGHL